MKTSNFLDKNLIKIKNKEWVAFTAISAFVLVKILIALYGNPANFQDSDFSTTLFIPAPVSSSLVLEIFLILVSAGCLSLTYLTCAELFGKSPGFFSVLLAIGTLTFFERSSILLTDILSIFFALAAVYFFVKNRLTLSSAMVLATLFFNILYVLLMPLFISALFLRRAFLKSYLKVYLPFIFVLFLTLVSKIKLPDIMQNFDPGKVLLYFPELLGQNLFYAFFPISFFFLLKDFKKDKKPLILIGYLTIELALSSFRPSGLINLILPSAAISGYGFYRTLLTKTGTSWKGVLIILIIAVMAVLTLINLTSETLELVSKRF